MAKLEAKGARLPDCVGTGRRRPLQNREICSVQPPVCKSRL